MTYADMSHAAKPQVHVHDTRGGGYDTRRGA